MSDRWTERLSEYLDGDMTAVEREALAAHLAECRDCATVLEDLRAVAGRAASLDDRPPAHDLWPGIAARIGASRAEPAVPAAPARRARVFRFPRVELSVPQLAAAAVALMLLSGVVVSRWTVRQELPVAGGTAATGAQVAFTPAVAEFGGAGYDSAVADLERVLAAGRSRLDTATVRIIEENLAIIDQAIAQARSALVADPGSVYLNNHLAGTLKRKVDLLRRVSQLTTVQS